jgi:hypothetical protein
MRWFVVAVLGVGLVACGGSNAEPAKLQTDVALSYMEELRVAVFAQYDDGVRQHCASAISELRASVITAENEDARLLDERVCSPYFEGEWTTAVQALRDIQP